MKLGIYCAIITIFFMKQVNAVETCGIKQVYASEKMHALKPHRNYDIAIIELLQ